MCQGLLTVLIKHLTVLLEYIDILSQVTGHKTHERTEADVPTIGCVTASCAYRGTFIDRELTIYRVAVCDFICL